MALTIHTAPPDSGDVMLGRTLPSLLDEVCAAGDIEGVFQQPVAEGWTPLSLFEFRAHAEEMAAGLRNLGLEAGDRVCLFMESDVHFCIADMGCLIARLTNVPLYLNYTPDLLAYVTAQTEAKALVVTNMDLLEQLAPVLPEMKSITHLIVADPPDEWPETLLPALPARARVMAMGTVREQGRAQIEAQPNLIETLKADVQPHDLATLIYTSGTTGQPKGVMLTHENISFNALTAYSGFKNLEKHGKETAISFLPLTHIFARTMHYGALAYGIRVYFTTPKDVAEHFKLVRPTLFATVPRILEKVYDKIMLTRDQLTGAKRKLLDWAIGLARQFELGKTPKGTYALQLKLADRLVLKKWREALGGQLKYMIAGGAALRADLANLFGAAGIVSLQGYGLTETSPVITYNRPYINRAGTVGPPMAGVEVAIAEDGEILTRGPHVMKGYYKNPEATAEAIDADGWFHTGDIGTFDAEGCLRITDRKKALFKLSTGKYVTPQPLENKLVAHTMIEHAMVLGPDQKFCSVLLFPNEDILRTFAETHGLSTTQPLTDLVKEPLVQAEIQNAVDAANEGMPHWSCIKKFCVAPAALTVENELLTPTLKMKRARIVEAFAEDIGSIYDTG